MKPKNEKSRDAAKCGKHHLPLIYCSLCATENKPAYAEKKKSYQEGISTVGKNYLMIQPDFRCKECCDAGCNNPDQHEKDMIKQAIRLARKNTKEMKKSTTTR